MNYLLKINFDHKQLNMILKDASNTINLNLIELMKL